MKIVQLDIEGFRSLKNVSWRPGNLNVIIGPNGSGKSNLLRMLELIVDAAQGQLSRYVQSTGGMKSLVWDGEAFRIVFKINFTHITDLPDATNYRVELQRLGNSSSYRVEMEHLIWSGLFLRRDQNSTVVIDNTGTKSFPTQINKELIDENELLLPLISNPLVGYPSFVELQASLTGWTIYHDVRVDRNASIRQPVISRLEDQVSPDGQNLINVLHTLYTGEREFKRQVNSAMRAAFGEDFEELNFQPDRGDQRIQMRVRWKTLTRDQSTTDLSDGTLRFLFLIAVLASPNPAPLIAIDEPETGLHPSMLPIVAELAVDAAERTQVVFTTHSDQFLDAFRETATKPTTTVARWENGETTLTTLDDEELAYWLKEYSLGSLFRSGELENMAS